MKVIGKSVASIQSSDGEKFGPNGGFTAVLSTASLDRDGDTLLKGEWMDLPDWLPLDIDHGRKAADTIGKFHPYWDGDVMMMDAYFASTAQAQEVRTLIKDLSEEDGSGCPLGVSVFFGQYKNRKSGEPQRELLNAGVVGIPANRDAVIVAAKSALAIKDVLDESDAETSGQIRDAILETFGVNKSVAFAGQTAGMAVEGLLSALVPSDVPLSTVDVSGIVPVSKAVDGNMALLQAIHDASIHLGAMCAQVTEPDGDEASGASEGANKSFDAVVVGKSVKGSVEDLSCRVNAAVRAAYGPCEYPWVRATFLDDGGTGGTVVYQLDCEDGGTYARSFTDDGAEVTLGADVRSVALVTTVSEVAEKSLGTVENPAENPEIATETKKLTLDEFKAAAAVAASAFLKTSTQEDSPADGEEPAPADEAAAASDSDAAEADVVDDAAFKSLKLRLSLSESL